MINFFDSDVPGFPLRRIHILEDGTRVFGVPVTWNISDRDDDGTCTLQVDVITNRALEDLDEPTRELFKSELEERLGFSEALSIDDVLSCCETPEGDIQDRHNTWKKMVEIIFPRLQNYYGDRIRCGRFYSRTYGLLRLVSTWNVPGGEKQEIIMTSNLLKTVGRKIPNEQGEAINLHLLPTYEEILDGSLEDFPEFEQLKNAVEDFGDQYLTNEYSIDGQSFYLLDEDVYVPRNAEKWDRSMESVQPENRELLIQLKEDMNRMYQRPFVLIVYLYNVFQGLDFSEFSRQGYAEIYQNKPRTMYPKVLGMILQQAFGNYECIPVDTWVETVFEMVLETPSQEIPNSGSQLGKFERFIWETSQLRKTNQPLFDDIIHCIKTGIMHSKDMHMRNPNPLSCNLCSLSGEGCPTYEKFAGDNVAIVERSRTETAEDAGEIELVTPAKKNGNPDKELYLDTNDFEFGELANASFIVLTKNGRAIASYSPTRKDHLRWKRTDEMSPFTTHITLSEGIFPVHEVMSQSSS